MKIPMTLNSLGELDNGKIVAAFDHELRHVVRDCVDRPGDKSSRVVTLQLNVTPDPDERSLCETVLCEFTVKSQVPPRRTKAYQLEARANGAVLVNPASPESIRQGTLDEAGLGAAVEEVDGTVEC